MSNGSHIHIASKCGPTLQHLALRPSHLPKNDLKIELENKELQLDNGMPAFFTEYVYCYSIFRHTNPGHA